jgi:hypothetical protein
LQEAHGHEIYCPPLYEGYAFAALESVGINVVCTN